MNRERWIKRIEYSFALIIAENELLVTNHVEKLCLVVRESFVSQFNRKWLTEIVLNIEYIKRRVY